MWLGRPPWGPGDSYSGRKKFRGCSKYRTALSSQLNTITNCKSAMNYLFSPTQFHCNRILIRESKINAEWGSMWILVRNTDKTA
jgi:hypothetical protein